MPGVNQSLSGHQASAVTVPPGPTPTIPKGNTGLAAMAEARDPRREMQENEPSLPESACRNGLEGYFCVKGNGIIMAACNEAKAAGLFVVSSSLEEMYEFKLHGLDRCPLRDPESFESYELAPGQP